MKLDPTFSMSSRASNRLRICLVALALIGALAQVHGAKGAAASTPACNTPTGPFCDAGSPPSPGWTGHVFHLSQSYPSAAGAEPHPWTQYNPQTQSTAYLKAALAYFYEGNTRDDVESCFDPSLNSVRAWYN